MKRNTSCWAALLGVMIAANAALAVDGNFVNLNATGATTLGGTLDVTGGAILRSTLDVTGGATLRS
ncbi:hypothetical protein, partial [Pyramidobacter sp.]